LAETSVIRTPDQRVRVFVSSALEELAAERHSVREAIARLRLVPVMFELGARPHGPRNVYRAYLDQSHIFVGIYWQSYGWVAPGEQVSGLEDEYLLSAGLPRLIYVKSPAPDREPRLAELLGRIKDDGDVSYQHFSEPGELRNLVENDLAVLLSEHFATAQADGHQDEPAWPLPSPATPLLGREQEATAACDLVLSEGVRLVTLTGPGGVGKSRLALEVASRLGARFAHGVRLVDLAPVQSAELVLATIATALGLRTSGGPLAADVEAYLRGRRLVLVLDNFEQVTGAAPVVAGLLAAAPGLVVLVTSRTALRLSGEHDFPVPPLPTPQAASGDGLRLDDLRSYASVQLFAERAHAAAPGFELTAGNAEVIAEICRRLDGLPLAIELAAAWVRLLPPQALLTRLSHPLSVLTGGARDLPERQRTLRNTLDWSFSLLSPAEQALFQCLGVFPDGFDLDAAEAVCDGPGPTAGNTIDTLDSLVHASLVRTGDRAGQLRFSLFETIRDYARERLRENGQWNEARGRHAAHFLALAQSAAGLEGPEQLAWLDRLEAEHDNLSAAMTWFLDQGKPGPAYHLGDLTWRFWWFRGHAEELAGYARRIVAMGERMPPDQGGFAHVGLGFTLIASGRPAEARTLFEQALALFRRLGDKSGVAIATSAIGRLAILDQDYTRAGKLLRESLALQQELGHDESIALAYNYLGQIPLSQGDNDAAARLFGQGLVAARRVPDRLPLLVSLYNLALSRQAGQDPDGAAELLLEGLSVASDAGDDASVGYYLQRLAPLARTPERAVCLLAAADALLQAAGTGWLRAYVTAPGDDSLPGLRRQLGEAAFQRAWAQGMAMGRQRAVAYARQAADAGRSRLAG
jgi:predicted ATPase